MSEVPSNEASSPKEKNQEIKEIREQFPSIDPKTLREQRVARKEALLLLEERDALQDLAPGIDMNAFDRCVGRDWSDQMNELSNFKINLLVLQRDFGKTLSPKGVEALNRYLNLSMLDEVRARYSAFQFLADRMDTKKMPVAVREQVVNAAVDFNKIFYDQLRPHSVTATDIDGKEVLNVTYQPEK